MTESVNTGGRLRAYLEFLAALLYFFFAQHLAFRGAHGLAGEAWFPLVEQTMLVFLLLIGYAAMGFWFERQAHPSANKVCRGVPAGRAKQASAWQPVGHRSGLRPAAHFIRRHRHLVFSAGCIVGWLVADTAFFALAALAEEIAFRGYAFQRFAQAVGPIGASLGFAAIYAICKPSFRAQTTPASPSPSCSRLSFPRVMCAPAPYGSVGVSTSPGKPAAPCSSVSPSAALPAIPGGAGRSHGFVLAHRRCLRTRRQLAHSFCASRGPARGLSHHARPQLPLQRSRDRTGGIPSISMPSRAPSMKPPWDRPRPPGLRSCRLGMQRPRDQETRATSNLRAASPPPPEG